MTTRAKKKKTNKPVTDPKSLRRRWRTWISRMAPEIRDLLKRWATNLRAVNIEVNPKPIKLS